MLLEKTSWEQMSPNSMPFFVPGASPISEQVFIIKEKVQHFNQNNAGSVCGFGAILPIFVCAYVFVCSVSGVPADVWQGY